MQTNNKCWLSASHSYFYDIIIPIKRRVNANPDLIFCERFPKRLQLLYSLIFRPQDAQPKAIQTGNLLPGVQMVSSGTRVAFFIHVFETLIGHVRIDFRTGDRLVSKQLLYGAQIGASR